PPGCQRHTSSRTTSMGVNHPDRSVCFRKLREEASGHHCVRGAEVVADNVIQPAQITNSSNLSTYVALNVGAELGKNTRLAPALFVMISKVRPDRCLIILSLLERFRFSRSM